MSNDRFKFRIWDDTHKHYLPNSDAIIDGRTGSKFHGSLFSVVYIIEQCTGVKDKTGKLIYEGDVVVEPKQYPFYDYADNVTHKSLNETFGVIEHDEVLNYIGVVEWSDETAQFVIVLRCVNPSKNGISDGCCHYFDEDTDLEIIDNIHEMESEND